MSRERWTELDRVVAGALEIPVEEQTAYLDRVCGGSFELRAKAESLLAIRAMADGFLEVPVQAKGISIGTRGTLPANVGRYRIVRVLGEGSMGTVYEAEQQQPRRTIALKVIQPGLAGPEVRRRFELEFQMLGRLQHPGIAQIYEAGTAETEFGQQPYFAMELIQGRALHEYAKATQLDIRQRVQLMVKVCDAVHHAHQRGIIHRDLKPANILVDGMGHPKILDFGVAIATYSNTGEARRTHLGQLVGTLAYMSPEQVLADPLEIDTRSDVYALGVILFELLAKRPPYQIGHQLHEALRAIREDQPPRLGSLNRNCRGDLENITAKALENSAVQIRA